MSHRAVAIRTEMKKKPTCPLPVQPPTWYPSSTGTRTRSCSRRPTAAVTIGGCVVYGNDPKWVCRVCGTRILADGTAAVSEAV